jgi:hypothetical protein
MNRRLLDWATAHNRTAADEPRAQSTPATQQGTVKTGAHINVADVMTKGLISIGADAMVKEALQLMLERNISGLPVLAASNSAPTVIVRAGSSSCSVPTCWRANTPIPIAARSAKS